MIKVKCSDDVFEVKCEDTDIMSLVRELVAKVKMTIKDNMVSNTQKTSATKEKYRQMS